MAGLQALCSTRNLPKESIGRSRNLGREAALAVQALKGAARSRTELAKVLKTRVSRLVKIDMVQTLNELQRQREGGLAFEVFKLARKEPWYEPDAVLYRDLIELLAKNSMKDELEELVCALLPEDETGTKKLIHTKTIEDMQ